ncbi:hypothetical protein C3F09_00820 [candidate division GN15 bacterium]|uniref:CxxxxCH/CxxCH domain-containing protein n=1 Tax=candidate division GN15 bacterium TaxID=2072418 RepID=A0A855X5A8_9BACT|nr:MAG: hypothetical protein C3F09_00820 [candidate division GN15 bacterium]
MMIPHHRPVYAALLITAAIFILSLGCSEDRTPPTLPGSHPASWMDQTSPDFHGTVVFHNGVSHCQSCHGSDLGGGKVHIACSQCHAPGVDSLCTRCHGGLDNNTGAPPLSLRGYVSPDSVPVGAHTAHLSATSIAHAFDCNTCHVVPGYSWDSAHLDFNIMTGKGTTDSIAEVTFHGLAVAAGAAYTHSTATCRLVYCHGNFSGGDSANTPVWNGHNQAACGSCHDVGSNPVKLGTLHQYHISLFGLECADCHANVVDTALHIVNVDLHVNGSVDRQVSDTTKCEGCHAQGTSGCTQCHGGVDNQTGAPPRGLRGETAATTRAVGAHTSHLTGGHNSAEQRCGDCHLTYTSVADSGHFALDSVAEVIWGGFANRNSGANWNRNANTCANTYCHGNFTGGKTSNTPNWTATGQADCGSCHDVGSNPSELQGIHGLHVSSFGLTCNDCHAGVVDANKSITNRSLHVNGVVDTATANPSLCTGCHADAPAGCVYCHGGTDNQTGAPPKGLRGETATTTRAVGAHTIHLAGGTFSDSVQCVACHPTYTNVADPGHFALDSVAEVVWGSISNQSGGAAWTRSTNTCSSTYCHGNFTGGKTTNTPNWTASGQAACGSCHDVGDNPAQLGGAHSLHITSYGLTCNDCHANVVDAGKNIVNRLLHVNGVVDTAAADPSVCAKCHAAAPAGCVYCHGGIDNQTGAPPKGLRGETATTTIAVGAHTKHMNGSALAGPLQCRDCHLSYTYVTDSGHFALDSVAEIVWGNFANSSGGATWSRSSRTCSSTYCHGNFAGGMATNAPVWTSASQAACGSCHDVGIHPSLLLGKHSTHAGEGVACYKCHYATLNSSDLISNPNAHVNGVFDVRFWTGTGSWNAATNSCNPPGGSGCHGRESWY